MKLKLNHSLRAALMACYAISAPIATTVTTGALITGAITLNLAPQAAAVDDTSADASSEATYDAQTEANTYYNATDSTSLSTLDDSNGVVYIQMLESDPLEGSTKQNYMAGNVETYTFSTVVINEMWINNGNSNAAKTFTGTIVDGDLSLGSGAITFNNWSVKADVPSCNYTLAFTGDVSGFSGAITSTGLDGCYAGGLNLIFSGTSSDKAASGTGLISLEHAYSSTAAGTETLTYNYTTSATIANSSIETWNATFAGGAAYTLNSDTTVNGALSITDGSDVTLSTDKTLTAYGSVTGTGASSLDIEGTLVLGADASLTADANLSLDISGASLELNASGQIIVNAANALTLDASTSFDLTAITALTSTLTGYSFNLFTTDNASDLSSVWDYIDVSDLIFSTDVANSLTDLYVTYNSDGSISWSENQTLVYKDGGEFVWSTENNATGTFYDGSTEDNYSAGANLTISGNDATATLGSNVDPTQLTIDNVSFTIIGDTDAEGNAYTMNCDLVSFIGNATLILEDAVLGADAVIGTGGVTTATVKFSLDAGVAVDYTNQLKGFAGNLVLSQDSDNANAGTITIGDASVEGFDSSSVTLNFNTVEILGGTLNLGYDLTTTNLTVSNAGTVANFAGAVNVTGTITLGAATATFDSTVGASAISINGAGNYTFNSTFDTALNITATTISAYTLTFNASTSIGQWTMANNYSDSNMLTLNLGENVRLNATNFAGSEGKILTDLTVNLDTGSNLIVDHTLWIYSDLDLVSSAGSQGGTLTSTGLFIAYSVGATVDVGAGTSLVVNATSTSSTNSNYSDCFTISGNSKNGTLNIEGSVVVANAGISVWTGKGTINVKSGGSLTLGHGLEAAINSSGSGELNVQDGGKLILGNQTDAGIDYTSGTGFTVNMQGGSTITDNGSAVSVETTLKYAAGATITFAGSDAGSLTMKSAISNAVYDADSSAKTAASTVSAIISGNVTFAGAADLAAVTVSEGATLTISGDYTFNSAIDNSGTVSILAGASLDISSLIDKTYYGDYSITLINGGTVTLDANFDCATYFTEASLDGLTNLRFVDGVLYYTIAGDIIRYSSGGSIPLGIGEVVNGVTYSDTTQVVLQDLPVTVNLTTDVAAECLGVDGIVATFTTGNGSKLNSDNIIICNAGTLVVTGDILGDNASFTNSDSDATIEFVLGTDDTVTYTNQLNGFTGTIAISGDGVYLDTSDGAQTFTNVIVNEGATFKLDEHSWNITTDDITRSVTLVGGEDADSTATFAASNSSVRADFNLSGYVTLDATNSTFNLYGDIVNTGGEYDMLIKTGTGTLYVYGDANYTGDLDIQAGGISFESTITGALDDITMASGTSLSFANAVTVGSLALNGGTASFNGGLQLADSTSLSISSGSTLNISTSTNITSLTSNSATVGLTNVSAADMLYTVTGSGNVLNLSGTTTLNSIEASTTASNGYSLTINVADNASASFDYNSPSTSINDLVSNSNYVYAYRTKLDIVLGSNATLDMDANFWIAQYNWTISMEEDASNGVVTVNGILVGYSESTSLTINAGATLEIEGTTLASNAYTSSFTVGGSGNASVVDIYGTLEANSGIYRHGTGSGTINVQSGGLLIMNDGLKAISAYDSGSLSLNVLSGGVLSLGNQSSDTTDYNGEITVNISNGATITNNGADETTTVYTTLTYAENATVNFKADTVIDAESGGLTTYTLKMNSAVSGYNISANIVGTGIVEFAGGSNLAGVTMGDDSTLTLSGTADHSTGNITKAADATTGYDLAITATGTNTIGVVSGADSISISGGGTTTLTGAVSAASVSLVNSTVTFDESLTVAGALSLVSAYGEWNANNIFTGAVDAGSITIQYGNHNFNSSVDVTDTITLNGGISTFTGAVTAASIDANDGTTTFSGSVSVSESFTIDGGNTSVTVGTLTGAGNVTVNSGTLTLTTDADADYTGTLALNGGALVVTDGTLDAAISVTANSSLSASELNSTITLSDGVSLNLGGNTVTFGDDFSIDLNVTSATDYTIFTGLGADCSSSLSNSNVASSVLLDYTVAWVYSDDSNSNGTLKLTTTSRDVVTWVDDTTTTVSSGDKLVVDAGTEAQTVSKDETITVGSVLVQGDAATTISTSITSDTIVKEDAGTMTVEAELSAGTSISLEGGTTEVTGENGSIKSDVTISNDATLVAGAITVSGDGASVSVDDGSIVADALTNTAVTTATVTVTAVAATDGIAVLDGSSICEDSTLDVQSGTLELTNDATVSADTTLSADASVKAGLIILTGKDGSGSVTYSDNGSLTSTTHTNATISNTTVTFGASDTTPSGSGILSRQSSSYTNEVSTTGDHYTGKSGIGILSNTAVTLTDVIIDADTTVTKASDSSLSIAGDSTLYASVDNNLSVDTATTDTTVLTITTFTGLTEVSAIGTLNLVITLGGTDWTQFLANIDSTDYITQVVLQDVSGGTITDDMLTELTVNINVTNGTDSYDYVPTMASYSDVTGDLTLTIPEPSTTALSLMALAGLLARRRRRQSVSSEQ